MKKIKQKNYALANASGKDINVTDNLLLAINGITTGKLLKEFFITFKQHDDKIVGHSPLGDFPIVEHRIKLNDKIFVSIVNKNTDEEIFFTKITEPYIQAADKEIDEENFNKNIIDLYKVLFPEDAEEIKEEEIPIKIEEEQIKIEVPEVEITEVENLEEEEENVLIESPVFEKDAEPIIAKGYKLYKNENYRFLYKKGEKPEGILVLLVNSDTYQKLKLKKTGEDEKEITFDVSNGQNKLILQDEKISIS